MDPEVLQNLPLEKLTGIALAVMGFVVAMVFVVMRNNRIIEKLIDLISKLTTKEKP